MLGIVLGTMASTNSVPIPVRRRALVRQADAASSMTGATQASPARAGCSRMAPVEPGGHGHLQALPMAAGSAPVQL
jgi:hypothetical protein